MNRLTDYKATEERRKDKQKNKRKKERMNKWTELSNEQRSESTKNERPNVHIYEFTNERSYRFCFGFKSPVITNQMALYFS